MIKTITRLSFALAITISATSLVAEETLKIAAQEGGTVNWELNTIMNSGFDTANGYTLEAVPVSMGPAGKISFQGGETDIMVSDWIWVASQRAEGNDYRFIPYSTSVGALMVKADAGINSLADLKGKKIGIAGGPLDKSWLLLQAYAQQTEGLDLAVETEQVFGAPPLIFGAALKGDVDAAINFWHFQAKMAAAGMVELQSIGSASEALGLDPKTPLLGYVVKGEDVDARPELYAEFAQSSKDAKSLLASDSTAWDAIREIMNAKDDAQFEALKAGFIAGIPSNDPIDEEAADRMLQLMAKLGGEDLVGKATTLPEGTFYKYGN